MMVASMGTIFSILYSSLLRELKTSSTVIAWIFNTNVSLTKNSKPVSFIAIKSVRSLSVYFIYNYKSTILKKKS